MWRKADTPSLMIPNTVSKQKPWKTYLYSYIIGFGYTHFLKCLKWIDHNFRKKKLSQGIWLKINVSTWAIGN